MLKPTLMRLIDFLKQRRITAVYTSLVLDTPEPLADSQIGVSSLMDTWLLLMNQEHNGERTRTLQVLKSRGMAHSNQVREFLFSDHGIDLVDIFMSDEEVAPLRGGVTFLLVDRNDPRIVSTEAKGGPPPTARASSIRGWKRGRLRR